MKENQIRMQRVKKVDGLLKTDGGNRLNLIWSSPNEKSWGESGLTNSSSALAFNRVFSLERVAHHRLPGSFALHSHLWKKPHAFIFTSSCKHTHACRVTHANAHLPATILVLLSCAVIFLSFFRLNQSRSASQRYF